VISTGFADIFRNNSLKNGLLPVTLTPSAHSELLNALGADPRAEVTIDLASQTVSFPRPPSRIPHPPSSHTFPIDPFARHCLLNGVDELGFLLAEDAAITAYEAAHPARTCTL
jgi:3-isopropylmalate/(R)-2-methylmalate dehydratase small subunit